MPPPPLSPEEHNGETSCWIHYIIGVLTDFNTSHSLKVAKENELLEFVRFATATLYNILMTVDLTTHTYEHLQGKIRS